MIQPPETKKMQRNCKDHLLSRNFKNYTLRKYLIIYLIYTGQNLEEYLMTTKKLVNDRNSES